VLVDLGNTTTPVNCVALFGLSSTMYGGRVFVKPTQTGPSDATPWTAMEDAANDEPAQNIDRRNMYLATREVYDSPPSSYMQNLALYPNGWDPDTNSYFRYWLVSINPPTGFAGAIGEVALCSLEAPIFNFVWGRGDTLQNAVERKVTLGGIEYAYQCNGVPRAEHDVSWSGCLDVQSRAQVREWYTSYKADINPLVFIPDDSDVTGGGVFYSRLVTPYADTERFFNQYEASLRFSEAVSFEEP
jgi:hypothetical protein